MYKVIVPDIEAFSQSTQEFITVKGCSFNIEHSLISLSKWESKWEQAFLGPKQKTREQMIDYVRMMTISKNVPNDIYELLTNDQLRDIFTYINSKQTATTIKETKAPPRRGPIITAEIIYYWMTQFGIPFECEKWHLNRLITLIRVCEEKEKPAQKMSRKDLARHNTALNHKRRRR